MNKLTIAYVAARSGGHIIPCVTLAKRDYDAGKRVIFLATNNELDKKVLAPYSFFSERFFLSCQRSPGILGVLFFVADLVKVFFQSLRTFAHEKPIKIITSGGYLAVPVCYAAWCMRIPIELYELNTVPGKASSMVAKIAQKTFVCFSSAQHYFNNPIKTDYPLRFDKIDRVKRELVLNRLGFDKNKRTILILGGSQGSSFLNRSLMSLFQKYKKNFPLIQVIHQAGDSDLALLKEGYEALGIPALVCAYTDKIADFYSAADTVIARAGAGTLWEIVFFKKPALIIPLEGAADNHQLNNAYAIAQEFSAQFTILRQAQVTPESLVRYFDTL